MRARLRDQESRGRIRQILAKKTVDNVSKLALEHPRKSHPCFVAPERRSRTMAKRAEPEEIIAKLREVEVRLSQGESVGMAAKSIENFNQSAREITRQPHCDRANKPISMIVAAVPWSGWCEASARWVGSLICGPVLPFRTRRTPISIVVFDKHNLSLRPQSQKSAYTEASTASTALRHSGCPRCFARRGGSDVSATISSRVSSARSPRHIIIPSNMSALAGRRDGRRRSKRARCCLKQSLHPDRRDRHGRDGAVSGWSEPG